MGEFTVGADQNALQKPTSIFCVSPCPTAEQTSKALRRTAILFRGSAFCLLVDCGPAFRGHSKQTMKAPSPPERLAGQKIPPIEICGGLLSPSFLLPPVVVNEPEHCSAEWRTTVLLTSQREREKEVEVRQPSGGTSTAPHN